MAPPHVLLPSIDRAVEQPVDPRAATPHSAEPVGPPLVEVVDELLAAVLVAADRGLHSDPVLVDVLETLALRCWDDALEHLALPRWSGLASPSHRWVVLERCAARLRTRLDEPALADVRACASTVRALAAVRRRWPVDGARSAPHDAPLR